MSDAPATPPASPAAAATDTTAKPDATKEAATAAPVTPAQRKSIRAALEGDEEKEYDLDTVRGNFLKGKNAAQMMTKADQRLREAQEKEKRWSGLSSKAKDKPLEAIRDFLKEAGVDVDLESLGEQMVLPRIQREMMSDGDRELLKERQAREAAESELKEIRSKEKEAEAERNVQEHQNRLGKLCMDALQHVGLPQESAPWAVKRMAALMDKVEDLNESGHEISLSPQEIATLVKEDFLNEHRSFTGNLSGEQIVQLYGEDFVKKVRSYDLQRLKARQMGGGLPQPPAHSVTPPTTNGAPKKKYMDESEWDAELKRRIQGG